MKYMGGGGEEGNDLLYFNKEKKESWDQGDRICVTWAGGHTEIHGAALPLPLPFFGICLRSFIIKKLKIKMQTWSLFSAPSPMGKQTRSPGRAVMNARMRPGDPEEGCLLLT